MSLSKHMPILGPSFPSFGRINSFMNSYVKEIDNLNEYLVGNIEPLCKHSAPKSGEKKAILGGRRKLLFASIFLDEKIPKNFNFNL